MLLATTQIYTLSLHDALPISVTMQPAMISQSANIGTCQSVAPGTMAQAMATRVTVAIRCRSEEHTSELQSRVDLVCRLLLEKKNWRRRPRPMPRACR